MIFGGKEVDLRGVYSEAAVLWSRLPSRCSKNDYINCGQVDLVLSAPLLELFDIHANPKITRRLNVSVYAQNDGYNRGMARIFADVNGAKVVFQVTSAGSGDKDARRLSVYRELPGKAPDTIQVKGKRKDRFVLAAFEELVHLRKMAMGETDKDLLCGSCPAKVNGLPRPKV